MANLKGQIALITGASRGIGREIAWRLAQAECDVVLVARSGEELSALAWEIKTAGREAMALVADLRDEAQIHAAAKRALDYFGRVDILVNNAGLWYYALVQDLSLQDWDEMFDVNLRGAFLCTKYLLPSMLERGQGHIVNIASVSGLIGETEGAGYCATKWGLRGFSDSLYKEVGPKGIRVTVIDPGSVNNVRGRRAEDQNVIQNEDIADLVLAAVTLPRRTTLYEAVLWPTREEYP
jgi:NADP-dependent 3-hydroxy acid dehydrogenase YdfG